MTDEDLVDNLRSLGDNAGYYPSIYHTAADAIERLHVSITRLREYPQITHAEGCWEWGRGHYGCALEEIKRLRERAERAEMERDAIGRRFATVKTAHDDYRERMWSAATELGKIERETIERCAKVVEEAMVGDVDSEITRGAADAYNDTNPHAMVHERLERMGQFIAAAIRAMRSEK